MPTPAIRPSTTSPSIQVPVNPSAPKPASARSVTGPENSVSKKSCSGAATVVVIWNTSHITARNSSGPQTGARATRSTRSDSVAGSSPSVRDAASRTDATQPNRSSARSRSSAQHGCGRGRGSGSSRTRPTASSSAARPSRRRGSRPTTGQPSAVPRAAASSAMPWRSAMSRMVSATTTRCGCSRTWATRCRLRARWAASASTTTTSGRSSGSDSSRSRVRASSGDSGSRE